MKLYKIFLICVIFLYSCSTSNRNQASSSEVINFTILQFNDFYEIAPLENGTVGGAARMATLRKKLLKENPNVLTVLAGDFLSPSLLGTLKMDGEGIKGKHIVEVLNEVGIDLVNFGNHEFDYDQKTLQKRINESKFDWISSNVKEIKDGKSAPFSKESNGDVNPIPGNRIIEFSNKSGQIVRIGIVAPCIDANKVKYVEYEDIHKSMFREINFLKGKVDLFISLSHLNKNQDMETAKDFPELDLILGGHEHDNMKHIIGKTILTKADANAKSAYVHRITYKIKTKKVGIKTELVKLNSSIPLDETVNSTVKKWKEMESRIIRNMGFDPDAKILGSKVYYDARETNLRNQPAEFCQMICRSMLSQCPTCDVSIMNSGSVRIDDILEGEISQYDILRALPYAGSLIELDVKGSLLLKVLQAGWNNKGRGGFLQWDQITYTANNQWLVKNIPIDLNRTYHIIINEFLLTGIDKGLEFLNKNNPEISNIILPDSSSTDNLKKDIRFAIIDYLKKGGR